MVNPPSGTYNEPIYVSLDENSHYSLKEPIYQNSWHTLATVPLPLRTRAGLSGTNLMGGNAHGISLFLNDRYDASTDTWTIDTDLPAAGYPLCSEKTVICDSDTGSWTAKWENSSFQIKNPCPRSVAQASFVDNILINGDPSVYEYKEATDCWTIKGHDHLFKKDAATIQLGEEIYSSSNGITKFDIRNNQSEVFSDYHFLSGSRSMCGHRNHFMVSGGEKQNQCLRVDVKTRSIYVVDPKLTGSSFSSVNQHLEFCAEGNSSAKFDCVYDHNIYKRPILLPLAGTYELFIAVLDKRFHPKIEQCRYLIRRNYVPVSIKLIEGKIYEFVWPSYERIDGSLFSIKDLIPRGIALWIGEGNSPLKMYSHELLESQPGLNKPLQTGENYRIRLGEGSQYLILDAYEILQTNNKNKKES